ncbi:MAG: DNA mismatch repair endonuclease MutL [Holosporaceae bacterium]|jgi:DNA mismatch repair protein MutL|nr:DNA mismatch repair endonuclease MutL [Holosporaceae bacterium]
MVPTLDLGCTKILSDGFSGSTIPVLSRNHYVGKINLYMFIRILPQHLVNQIAAGEVVERPSSAIKELIENALDAGATNIAVSIDDGGKSYMAVSDDGIGMHKDELEMCLLSHATSKLTTEDLFDIETFGFRGEALPSIASISKLSITSAPNVTDASNSAAPNNGWCLTSTGTGDFSLKPTNCNRGTLIEVRDLFFATPARLKFLKTDTAEAHSCHSIFNRLALAFPEITFKFTESRKVKFHYGATDAPSKRLADVLGTSFLNNVFEINAENDRLKLWGYAGVPTFNKASTEHQYFFVNRRFVKDKIFASALKSAYAGLAPSGRHAVAVLFLEIPFSEVDVNAHPAKTEVRFRGADRVRFFILSALKKSLESYGAVRPSTQLTNFFLEKQMEGFRKKSEATARAAREMMFGEKKIANDRLLWQDSRNRNNRLLSNQRYSEEFLGITGSQNHGVPVAYEDPSTRATTKLPEERGFRKKSNSEHLEMAIDVEENKSAEAVRTMHADGNELFPYSTPSSCASNTIPDMTAIGINNDDASPASFPQPFQINNTYIVTPHENGLMIIDQHAVAERITLERLKKNISLDSQTLLLPEIYHLPKARVEDFRKHKDLLIKFGIHFEELAGDLIRIDALPVILGNCNVQLLMDDITDELSTFGYIYSLDEIIHRILSKISCHCSLKAGIKLSLIEINYFINQIKTTKNIAQCCHGRPSYVILPIEDLDKFFERS